MKIIKIEYLIDIGDFSKSSDWKSIKKDIISAIQSIKWPPGSESFTILDQSGKKRGQGSGVKPIKKEFMTHLETLGWNLETGVPIAVLKRTGRIDATRKVGKKLFCVEWETGNISSSHRSMNKMALGLMKNLLIGGILILPTRIMYHYLTDRVGNYQELEPYFDLWKSVKVKEGILAVIAIEHDSVCKNVPRIPKGTNGRALM